ncbi:Glutamate receptor 2.8 [Spatholobus suberectus]|nr:Glutamate receptor 2.8 [Spatholobus suberectus]
MLNLLNYLILCLWPLPVIVMAREVLIPVGVVLDLNSPIGSMANSCIWMAYHDFYKQHPRFQTRLDLRTRDSDRDTVTAAYAASDLIMKQKVKAITGPQTSEQTRYVINLGREYYVPIISFSATSPSLSPARTPIFIRTTQDDSSQVKAIAAVVEAYGWREVILIYENTEYGNGLIPHLIDALDAVDTKVPYRSVIDPNSEEPHILEELKRLKKKSTRVFLVHMTGEHGSKLFPAAEKVGMMSEGYGWVVTEGLSVELDPSAPERMDSMQGVLGVRPKVSNTERLEDLKKRWKALSLKENMKFDTHTMTLFGLWAYDTVWALAMAVENATNENQSDSLVSTILATKFPGLSGYFDLKGGQLEPSVVEVFNVIGHKERVIGYWSPERGLFRDDQSNVSQDKQRLRQPVWPGYTTDQPPKLRFMVAVRKGFTEFVKVESVFPSKATTISGFVVDVFLEALNALPFPVSYEFVPMEDYGALAWHLLNHYSCDAAVGDFTIVYNRTNYVDFTLPYLESGLSMVVSMKHDQRRNMWIFLKPLSWGLWLTTGAALFLTGFVVWFLEHRSNAAFRGTPDQQLGIVFWFSFSTLVFAHRERLVSNWSRFVLIVWVFAVLIITQSYTASLASMLTIESLRPEFIDMKEIKRNNYFVGYQNHSFAKTILTNQLGLSESQLKAYNTPEEYHEALSKGTNNGGVAAIIDESPYINVFLSKYDTGYAMVGPFYKTNGLAFAFPLKSPLVSYFSRAILNVIEDKDKFEGIKNKYFSTRIVSKDQSASNLDSQSLTVSSFAGLFIVTMIASFLSFSFYVFSLLYSQWSTLRSIHSEQTSFWSFWWFKLYSILIEKMVLNLQPTMDRNQSKVQPTRSLERNGASCTIDGIDNHSKTNYNHNDKANVVLLNEDC